jgi:hypothetical protein
LTDVKIEQKGEPLLDNLEVAHNEHHDPNILELLGSIFLEHVEKLHVKCIEER